jgi:hypothetical protein
MIQDTLDTLWRPTLACVDAAPACDRYERAAAVTRLLAGLEATPLLATPETRRAALDELRAGLKGLLAQIPLGEPADTTRAATALEIFVSLNDLPPNLDHDYPGLRARVAAVVHRLGLGDDRVLSLRLRNRLLFEYYGDLYALDRDEHLLKGFFDLVIGDEPVVSDRARALCRTLLVRLMSNFDHFLWYHARVADRARFEGVFARNERPEVLALLRDLLADDAAFERMLADDDLRHGGRTRHFAGIHKHVGMDHLRRVIASPEPVRWIEMGGGTNTAHRAEILGLHCPTTCIDLIPEASGLDHQIMLVIEDKRTRLMTAAEIDAYRALMASSPIGYQLVNLLDRAALQRCVPPVLGRTLFTCAAYLVSIRPQDEEMRGEALRRRIPGTRVGAMEMVNNILSLPRPGDVLALFGRSVVPYLRGVGWLVAEVNPAGGLTVSGVSYRRRFPGFTVRWEVPREP